MDAQLRKERMEAEIIQTREGKQRYAVVLLHNSEDAVWRVWRGTNGRWYGTNDRDNRTVDAPTLAVAKLDIRLGYTHD